MQHVLLVGTWQVQFGEELQGSNQNETSVHGCLDLNEEEASFRASLMYSSLACVSLVDKGVNVGTID